MKLDKLLTGVFTIGSRPSVLHLLAHGLPCQSVCEARMYLKELRSWERQEPWRTILQSNMVRGIPAPDGSKD